MIKISNKPQVLQNKVLLTFLAGVACLIFGTGYFIFANDRVFLIMSILLTLACAARGIELYFIIGQNKFDVYTGTCVGISQNPLRKLRTVRMMDKDGNEFALKLQKTDKLVIGNRYRFYFKKTNRISTGYDFVDARLSTDNFLGFEVLPHSDTQKRKPQAPAKPPAKRANPEK